MIEKKIEAKYSLEQCIRTVKGQNNFENRILFLTCYWRFLPGCGTSNCAAQVFWTKIGSKSSGFRVSVLGVKSLGGHFACLCRGFEFYEVKKILLLFFKKKMEILLHFLSFL